MSQPGVPRAAEVSSHALGGAVLTATHMVVMCVAVLVSVCSSGTSLAHASPLEGAGLRDCEA